MLQCEKCGREFKTPQALRVHQKFCKGAKNKENKTEVPEPSSIESGIDFPLLPQSSGVMDLYRRFQQQELENLLLEDLKLRIEERRAKLQKLNEGRVEEDGQLKRFLDELQNLKSEIRRLKSEPVRVEKQPENDFKGDWREFLRFMGEIANFLGVNEMKRQLSTLQGKIDENYLKLREIGIEAERRKDEALERREIVNRVADAFEKGLANLGHAFGQGLAMADVGRAPASRNFIVVGNKIRAVCQKCGAEVEREIEKIKENGGELTCMICGNTILSLKQTGESSKDGGEATHSG